MYARRTPSTLDEAIADAISIGPLSEIHERTYHVIRDFMAQKFATAYMQVGNNEAELLILQNLFEKLTRRDK